MDRYWRKANSMRYDRENRSRASINGTGGGGGGGAAVNAAAAATNSDMSDWGKSYVASPPSSRYGEDDASSITHSRPRRSRLDNDIQAPLILQPLRPSSSRKSTKSSRLPPTNGGINPNLVNGRRSANGGGGHNSTFNGYELHYQRHQYSHNSSRNANDTYSGRYPPSNRNVSAYAIDYLNSRNGAGVGLLPNKMREPTRPRSTAAGKYNEGSSSAARHNAFGGYESADYASSVDKEQRAETEDEAEEEEEEEEDSEEELRKYYLQSQRAQGSRSATTMMTARQDQFVDGGEAYYFGVVHLDLELVAHVMKSIPPPPEYYNLQPIEKVAYIFYCAVYKKPYHSIEEFHKRFNREFYKFVCAGDSNDLALFKICKSMQDQYTLRQLEASKRAYEQAQKEALENEKLDFNKHRSDGAEEHYVELSQPEDVLDYGPLKFHTGHAFASFGIGGKMVVIRPAGSVDPNNGAVLTAANIAVEDLRSMLHADELSAKIIDLVQSFKGPLIAGQTPAHSVRLYIQRQIDALKMVEKAGDVKKSEVIDALLIWQLLEIMVQQHGRVTGPDVATLLTNASEELAERTGVIESLGNDGNSKPEAKERFNKFLLGGHINEAVESAISDGLYADAMTLIRRLHPNDLKKIEEIETRFMHLRSVDDPFATLVAVSSDQPPPILTNSSFDDDNNWKRHAAIILANLNSPTAMQTIYHLGLMLSKRERHCAADFCLLVVCILAGYDPFIPILHSDGEEKSRKHIGLVHGGSHLLNRVDGLSGIAGFSFTDLHATDIFDYALRLSNNNIDSPLARSKEYQAARIEYAKKLASYGGFATDAFRYCTEVARSLWPYVAVFDKNALLDLCDLAESLQYVAAASPAEIDWIHSLRAMTGGDNVAVGEGGGGGAGAEVIQNQMQNGQQEQFQQEVQQNFSNAQAFSEPPHIDSSLSFEAQKWHDEHQTPIEMFSKKEEQEVVTKHDSEITTEQESSQSSASASDADVLAYNSSVYTTTSTLTADSSRTDDTSNVETSSLVSPPPPPPPTKPPVMIQPPPTIPAPPVVIPKPVSQPIRIPKPQQPMPPTIKEQNPSNVAKSPRTELEDLWNSTPSVPNLTTKPIPTSVPPAQNAKNAPQLRAPQEQKERSSQPSKNQSLDGNDRKTSSSNRGWFGSIKEKVIKSIPSANQMILPDDSAPQIIWDPKLNKYVGAGIEEEVAAPPPPVMSAPHLNANPTESNKSSTASLRSARSGAGSRYFKPAMGSNGTSAAPTMAGAMPTMMPPPMMPPMMPTTFGFMPTATDDDADGNFDPFSGQPESSDPQAAKEN